MMFAKNKKIILFTLLCGLACATTAPVHATESSKNAYSRLLKSVLTSRITWLAAAISLIGIGTWLRFRQPKKQATISPETEQVSSQQAPVQAPVEEEVTKQISNQQAPVAIKQTKAFIWRIKNEKGLTHKSAKQLKKILVEKHQIECEEIDFDENEDEEKTKKKLTPFLESDNSHLLIFNTQGPGGCRCEFPIYNYPSNDYYYPSNDRPKSSLFHCLKLLHKTPQEHRTTMITIDIGIKPDRSFSWTLVDDQTKDLTNTLAINTIPNCIFMCSTQLCENPNQPNLSTIINRIKKLQAPTTLPLALT